MKELISNLQQNDVSLFTVVIITATALILIVILVLLLLNYKKKLKRLKEMRFGFAGKQLYNILLFVGLVISIPLTMYSVSNTTDMIRQANLKKDVYVDLRTVNKQDEYIVTFMAVPFLNDKPWGGKKYDVIWKISGNETFEYTEEAVGSDNISFFSRSLDSGAYEVSVYVQSTDFSVVKHEELILD